MRKPDFKTYIASGKNNLVDSKKEKGRKRPALGVEGLTLARNG